MSNVLPFPLRADLERQLQAQTERLAALPAFPAFQIDPEILETDDLEGLCYRLFPGSVETSPCGLLAVGLDFERLPVERWQWAHAQEPARSDSVVTAALEEAASRLGRTEAAGRALDHLLRTFGLHRSRRTYLRTRPRSLSPVQARVVRALGLCLAHCVDPTPLPDVRGFLGESVHEARQARRKRA